MKKLILSLFVLLVGIINFGYCKTVTNIEYPKGYEFYTQSYFQGTRNIKEYYSINNGGFGCIFVNNVDLCTLNDGTTTYNMGKNIAYCSDSDTIILNCTSTAQYFYVTFLSDDLVRQFYPELTKGECQVKYNLIPVENVDQHYCETNDLCPEQNECTGSGLDWSALFINNIQHPGKSIINVNIPDYIFWDYSTNEEEFNLYVGSGYDQDYIDSIIGINSYRPDSGDFTNIFVSGLTLIFPYIVITLFIVFVWRLLKRIFR